VGATISARDCEIRLGVSEIGNRKAWVITGYVDADYTGDLDKQRFMMG